jgi:hypothetical protein
MNQNHAYHFNAPRETVPINRTSGSRVGILMQAHIFFDDVAPATIGKPLFQ